MTELTVMISSAGRRAGLVGAVREAGPLLGVSVRVIATDFSAYSAASRLADASFRVPAVSDEAFIPAMLDLARRERVDVVIPTIDPELPVLAANREIFAAEGITIAVSDPETIEISSDKARSSAWFREHGFAVATQWSPEAASSLPVAMWPLFFKPLNGSSSIGAQPVDSPAQLEASVDRFGPGVVEELLVGDEYTMDCYVDTSGRCRAVVPRLRIATRAGEIAKGVTVRHPVLESTTAAIVEALPGARGVITVQSMLTETGPHVIEINPRFGGGYPLSHRAGAVYTAALLAESSGQNIDSSWFDWADDLVMLRYDEAVYVPRSELDDDPA